MFKIRALKITLFWFFTLFACGEYLLASEYLTIDEYNKLHPEQVVISNKFAEVVSEKGRPLKNNLQRKTVKIVFIYPGEQVSDYWRRSISSFKARMDELKIQYKIIEHFTKPAIDFRIQEKQIRKTLDQNPDFLVFTLDIKRHQRIIERIISRRTPKLILQNITTPLRIWEGNQPFLYVGFDHALGSKVIADFYIKKTEGNGKYSVLYFSKGYVSAMRGDTFINYLKSHSKLKLMSSYYTDGNRNKSKRAAIEILNESPDIKFIYACATDVALGAIDAITEKHLDTDILVNGWGGGSSELKAIKNNKMDVTVMRINDDNGVAMAEAIRYSIEGKEKQVPTIYSGSFELIEKGIDNQKLENLKMKAFRYSGK